MRPEVSRPKVFVYFNLIKKKFSIRDVKSGLVMAHSDNLFMYDAEFKVSEAGRQRVIRTKTKNVHAGVSGYILNHEMKLPFRATYNPYKYSSFIDVDRKIPVHSASIVHLYLKDGKGVIEYASSIDRF